MINRWFLELEGIDWRQSCFVFFGIFFNHFSLRRRAEERERRSATLRQEAWEAADGQGAGDTTGRERFENSASVVVVVVFSH